MADYTPTIGLEVHAELATRTKMFCDSLNDPDERTPNVNVCPVCLGHPGTLPTINKQAVEYVIKVGLAIGAKIAPKSHFDRKNYFYPDLPKGYQISQSGEPLVGPGNYAGVKIHHIHLEEDAGKLVHGDSESQMANSTEESRESASGHKPFAIGHEPKSTLVDFNRASVPLMELVTEPDMHSAEDAVAFMKELQLLFRYLGISDADLERGQMRADANISLSADPKTLGLRTEVKNLNSFTAVLQAIRYEIKRQTELLDKGEKVHQETRGWDEAKQKTVPQRSKEHAHDYRYFPEPDLPPIDTSIFDLIKMKDELPELPRAKQARFVREFGISDTQAAQLIADKQLANYFEAAVSELATRDDTTTSRLEKNSQELLFNYLMSDLIGLMNEQHIWLDGLRIDPNELAGLVDLIVDGKIMSRQAKDILRKMVETGESAETILNAEGLHTVSDESDLGLAIDAIIAENPTAVADYKKGKAASLQFLLGQAMKKLRGKGNPEILQRLFAEKMK